MHKSHPIKKTLANIPPNHLKNDILTILTQQKLPFLQLLALIL